MLGTSFLLNFKRILPYYPAMKYHFKLPEDIGCDILYFGGLALLGKGLFMWRPWLSFTICGLILMVTAYLIKGR